MDEFPPIVSDQQPKIVLFVVGKLTERYPLVCRIIDQQVTQLGMFIESRQRFGVACVRQHYSDDHVIKMRLWRALFSKNAAVRVHQEIKRFDAYLAKHRTEHRRLVLTVSVAMGKDFGGRMRAPTANSNFDCRIADIVLSEPR